MDPQEIIAAMFAAHIEDISTTAVTVADSMNIAAEVMVHALLSDRKILCAGSGNHSAIAQVFASHLLNRFGRERPGLPAIALSSNACLINAISEDAQYDDALARQISTLGNSGDILLLLGGHTRSEVLLRALAAAHDRELSVILSHGDQRGDAIALLDTQDVEIAIPVSEPSRLLEAQLMLTNCLCELIDLYLFGGDP